MSAAAVLVEEAKFGKSRERFEGLLAELTSQETMRMTGSELERELEKKGRELLRQLYEDHLALRGEGRVAEAVVGADKEERTHVRSHERKIETILGTVNLERVGYGGRGMDSLHPLDAELNLPPEKYSLEVRRRAALEVVRSSYDASGEALARGTGASVPKRQLEELVISAAKDFDRYYAVAREPVLASPDHLMVLTFDGKGVVMRLEGLREGTRKKAEEAKPKYQSRVASGEKPNRKRMAMVASVYEVKPWVRTPEEIVNRTVDKSARPRPVRKTAWASLEKAPGLVVRQAFQEAQRRDPERRLTWVVLVDGCAKQLRLVRKEAKRAKVEVTIVMDIFHVTEKLWAAAHCFHEEGDAKLEAWVATRLLNVLKGKASDVAAGIGRSATLRGLSASERKSADECAKYLLKHSKYLRYGDDLAKGLPIASGVIEGTCRHLINDRLDVTGARWGLEGAEAVLKLRAMWISGDFDEYWVVHENEEHWRNHASQYGNERPPATLKPTKGAHLSVVK